MIKHSWLRIITFKYLIRKLKDEYEKWGIMTNKGKEKEIFIYW